MSEEKKLYLIKSPIHPWTVWKTTNPNYVKDHLRFRDVVNNYPIQVPPTKGNRVDFINEKSSIKGYNYKIDGWIIIIRNGFIYQIVSNDETITYYKTIDVKWKKFKEKFKSFLNKNK